MWNILLTLIIIAVLWMLGSQSLHNINPIQEAKQIKNEKTTADEMTKQVQQQVDYARQLEKTEQHQIENNN